jgi:AcrR family transcriptional regulator
MKQELPTRERILAAAERLFAEDGYGGVSMPAIAKASGITAGAIYKHFESKEALFFEVVQRTVQSVPLTAGAAGEGATGLPRIVADYTTPRFNLLRRFAIEIHAASAKHAKVRRLLRRALDANTANIRADIIEAQQSGKIDASLDPELLASTILVFVMGLMHMETLMPSRVGDQQWHAFVQNRVAAILGLRA